MSRPSSYVLFYTHPCNRADGKYHMLPSGDLLVLDVGPGDAHLEFNCRYVNRLTGETFMSTRPGKIGLKSKLFLILPPFHMALACLLPHLCLSIAPSNPLLKVSFFFNSFRTKVEFNSQMLLFLTILLVYFHS